MPNRLSYNSLLIKSRVNMPFVVDSWYYKMIKIQRASSCSIRLLKCLWLKCDSKVEHSQGGVSVHWFTESFLIFLPFFFGIEIIHSIEYIWNFNRSMVLTAGNMKNIQSEGWLRFWLVRKQLDTLFTGYSPNNTRTRNFKQ